MSAVRQAHDLYGEYPLLDQPEMQTRRLITSRLAAGALACAGAFSTLSAQAAEPSYFAVVPVSGSGAVGQIRPVKIALAGAVPPAAHTGVAYEFNIAALLTLDGPAGTSPADATWSLEMGALPAGLLFDAGRIFGTPLELSSSPIKLTVVVSYRGLEARQDYEISVAQTYYEFTDSISGTATNYDLQQAALASGWDGVQPLKAQVTIEENAIVGSASTSLYAFSTGADLPSGSMLTLRNYGAIIGMGGSGGRGEFPYGISAGSPGGGALNVQTPLLVENHGLIAGGGGGGGAGAFNTQPNVAAGGGGGGGGQGFTTSAPGSGGLVYSGAYYPAGSAGHSGNLAAPGVGGTGASSGYYPNQYSAPWYCTAGSGGRGGALGESGLPGGVGTGAGCINVNGAMGGAAGVAAQGTENIIWGEKGTILGAVRQQP
ncbi:putative Ig domain-containing protein [Castellaniella sp.]|uniref:putative Ig domain-containing protein n=1 Tax=Castellaniella sp. TaxID=1955812 RepID=UPI0039C8A123